MRTLPAALSGAILFAAAGALRAQGPIEAMWNDASFQRSFVAGYGVNAEIEPRLSKAEIALLEKIQPLMATDLGKAAAELQLQIKPDSSANLDYTLGSIKVQQDDMPGAISNLTRSVEKFPSFRRAWRNLGLIHARLGNHDATIQAFTRMIELGGADAWSYGALGFAYSQKQDYQPAEASFRNALLLQPDNLQWRLGLTQCVLRQKKFEDAASLLDVLITRHPGNADFWLLQAHAFLGMKEPLRAAENLEIVDSLGKASVDSAFTLGGIYQNEGLADLAARAYVRAIDLDPKQPVARPMRAADGLAIRGALGQAQVLVAHMRKKMTDDLADADRRKLLKLEARFRMADGADGAEDVKMLEEVVALDPLDGEALL
ncbi:MAG: tetratricopeptide repeat protein, partial [Planctomycetota bacterium]|nr:tetratricopeptide repeat protein [Planctomycetota bacterium]